jgi:hypothetical protein
VREASGSRIEQRRSREWREKKREMRAMQAMDQNRRRSLRAALAQEVVWKVDEQRRSVPERQLTVQSKRIWSVEAAMKEVRRGWTVEWPDSTFFKTKLTWPLAGERRRVAGLVGRE